MAGKTPTNHPLGDSVAVQINAPASAVWDLVSDITRIGEFSPETFEAEWLGGATGPEVGASFRGHVKRNQKGPTYWTTCEVTVCEPERSFGFAVISGNKRVNNWRYDLEEHDGVTTVTESFHLEPSVPTKIYWAAVGRWRGETNRQGMRTTLERIKAVIEAELP